MNETMLAAILVILLMLAAVLLTIGVTLYRCAGGRNKKDARKQDEMP